MQQGNIVIISGPPGAGKSSIVHLLAESSTHKCAINIPMDDFYGYIRKGYIEPWRFNSDKQNRVVIGAMAACAKSFAEGGYEVFVDGVIGPNYLEPWIKIAQSGVNVFYTVLRPNLQATISRGVNRKGTDCLTDSEVIKQMWGYFENLGLYEPHVIDTTDQTVEESVMAIKTGLTKDCWRIV